VIVLTEYSSAFERDRAVAEGCSFGAAGDDADVEHQAYELVFPTHFVATA
jgi:hypothetical protein